MNLTNDTWAMILSMIGVAITGGLVHAVILLFKIKGEVALFHNYIESAGKNNEALWGRVREIEVSGTENSLLLAEHGIILENHGHILNKWDPWLRRTIGKETKEEA